MSHYTNSPIAQDGESVMVKVAKGQEDAEKLPAAMRAPTLGNKPIAMCTHPEMLLGYGDIVVPGIYATNFARYEWRTV